MASKVTVSICMGSSCFTRGNNQNIKLLQKYIEANGLEERVFLQGHLCEEKCQNGPTMKVEETIYRNVETHAVIDILLHHLQLQENR